MKLTGELKKQVEKTDDRDEKVTQNFVLPPDRSNEP